MWLRRVDCWYLSYGAPALAAAIAALTIEVSASLSHCSTAIWCFYNVEEMRRMSSLLLWVLIIALSSTEGGAGEMTLIKPIV